MAAITLDGIERDVLRVLQEIPRKRKVSGPQLGMGVTGREVAGHLGLGYDEVRPALGELKRVGYVGRASVEGVEMFWITASGIGGLS